MDIPIADIIPPILPSHVPALADTLFACVVKGDPDAEFTRTEHTPRGIAATLATDGRRYSGEGATLSEAMERACRKALGWV